MTFQSVKVYLLEISAPLLMHSNKTEKARPSVYSLISDQQCAVQYVRTWFPPDWGHRRIPSVSLCIIAFPLPPQSLLHHTGPPSLFIKNVITLLFARVKTNKTRFGGWTGGCSLYLCQETQWVSCNVMHLFPVQSRFPGECNRQEIVRWGECDEASLMLVYSGGKCDFS